MPGLGTNRAYPLQGCLCCPWMLSCEGMPQLLCPRGGEHLPPAQPLSREAALGIDGEGAEFLPFPSQTYTDSGSPWGRGREPCSTALSHAPQAENTLNAFLLLICSFVSSSHQCRQPTSDGAFQMISLATFANMSLSLPER